MSYVTGPELARHLVELSHALAGRPVDAEERAWKMKLLRDLSEHPDENVRGYLAAHGSLALLKIMLDDPDPFVRWRATQNPLSADLDVQLRLVHDPDVRVVLALVEAHDPGLETCRAIIDGPHVDVKLRLMETKHLSTDLLGLLARDRDRATAREARRQLDQRGGAVAA